MKKFLLMTVAAIFAVWGASAQDRGGWAVAPKVNVYTNAGADGALIGIGAAGRYSFMDELRVEASMIGVLKRGCSIDASAEAHYLLEVADFWKVYPVVGLGVQEIGVWSMSVNLGAGTDFSLNNRWDLTAGVKWQARITDHVKNPIVVTVGAAYKF